MLFSPYGVDINDIKAFSDTIYQNATKINDYESLCYAIYFAIRFDFVLNGFEIDYIAAQDYVIKRQGLLAVDNDMDIFHEAEPLEERRNAGKAA